MMLTRTGVPDQTPRCVASGLAMHCSTTVNPEIFARILFSRIGLKDTFVKLRIRD